MSTDQRKVQLGVEVDATEARQGFAEVKQGAREMAADVATSGQKAGQGLDQIGQGGAESAKKVDRATASIINSIQRTIAVAEGGERGSLKFYESIAKQRGGDLAVLGPYLKELDAAQAKQRAAVSSLDYMRMSAKETAYAMRGVPAQFTDIVTSLQGGQNPMTVLFQQGGQLKDMFGGVGNAAKALGSYVVGLVSPFTVVAAAAGAFGFAALKGAEESKALSKAIILTGNAANTTVGQLNQVAQGVAASTGATRGAAAAALEAVVGSAQISHTVLQTVATAAVGLERYAGKAVADTVAEFAAMGKEPVAASLKLNEQTRYLTAEIFRQIKAAEDRGEVFKATNLAQTAAAEAESRRLEEIKASLTTVERLWMDIKTAAGKAWDSMLDVGREDGLQQKLAKAQAKVASGGGFFGNLDDAKLEVSVLEAAVAAEKKRNEETAKGKKLDQDRIGWMKDGDQYLTKAQQKTRDLIKLETQYAEIAKSLSSRDEQAALAKDFGVRRKAIEAKYADKATGSAKKADPATDLINDLNKQVAVRELDALATGNLSAAEKKAVEVMVQLRDGTLKATEAQKIKIAASLEQMVVLDRELAAQREYTQAIEAQQRFMAKGRTDFEERIRKAEQEAELYGLTASQISAVEQSRLADAIAIAQQGGASEEQLAYLREELALRAQLTEALIKTDEKRQFADQFKKDAKELDEFAKNAAKGMQDAMAEFFFDPFKHGTQGLLQSFGQMIQKMIAQAVAADLARRMFGDLTKGGEGEGWFGAALKGLGEVFGFANGGIMTPAGPLPLRAYSSGGIATGPQLALSGEGSMNEAYVPLPDGRAIPVVQKGDSGGVSLHQTIYADKGTDTAKVRRAAAVGYRNALGLMQEARRYG